jgi:hypothetical protein
VRNFGFGERGFAQRGLRPAGVGWVTVIAAGLLVTGCSAGLADGAGDAALTPPVISASATAPVTGYDGLVGLPLSAYGTSEQDDNLLYRTRKALVVRCMKSRGHASHSGQGTTRIAAKTEEEKEAVHPADAWGYIGRATAKRIGFHIGVELPTGAPGLTGQAAKDFNTCSDEADKQLPNPNLAGSQGWKLTQGLFGKSFQLAAADSRVSAARKRWAACMTAAGHPAQDPEKLAAGPWKTTKATDDEIAVATADASCTGSSRLAAVYFAVLTGYQRQLISANIATLTAYQKQVREQTGRAARLLAQSPGT